MGRISNDPLCNIATSIVKKKNLSQFIETGTYKGHSLDWALGLFDTILTIEINENYYNLARTKYIDSHINFLLGDSRVCLSSVDLSVSSLIWLDAHSGGGKFGDVEDCPLLDELRIILNSSINHYIMIDDARAFCWPLSKPFDYSKWPTLNEIFSLVMDRYWISYIHDVLFLIPREETAEFQNLFSNYGETHVDVP